MIVHKRIIKKHDYEQLCKLRNDIYLDLFEKYKKDPNYNQYEQPINDGTNQDITLSYCSALAWWEAHTQTMGIEMEKAEEVGLLHPDFKRRECGCCHNLSVSSLLQDENGDYVITVEIVNEDGR